MKKITHLFFLYLIIPLANAQDSIAFTKRYTLNYLATAFTSIECTDSCIYITGSMYDTLEQGNLNGINGVFLSRLDTNGIVIHTSRLGDTSLVYSFWEPTLFTINNRLINCGYFSNNNWMVNGVPIPFASLFSFNQNGDTAWTRHYAFNSNNIFLQPNDLAISTNGSFVMGVTHRQIGFSYGRVTIWGIDSLGNLKWNKVFENPPHYNQNPSLELYFNNEFILSYNSNRAHYHCIDSVGNIRWTFYAPIDSAISAARDIIITRDSGIVFGSSLFQGTNKPLHGYVFKYKEGHGRLWSRVLGAEFGSDASGIKRLVELPNGNIIASGWGWKRDQATETIWVNLLSAQGDSLWSKHYYPIGAHPDSVPASLHLHHVYDMELTASGYLVLCGETISPAYHPEPQQQGWLLKLRIPTDTSQLHTAQAQVAQQGYALRLYPNPADSYAVLDLALDAADRRDYSVLVFDAAGRLVERVAVLSASGAYLLDVSGWASGTYAVVVQRGGVVVGAQWLVRR